MQNFYIYRCLERGLVGFNMTFRISEIVDVAIHCDSSAMALMATAAAMSAAVVSIF